MRLDAVLSIQAAAERKVCPICKAHLLRQDMAAHLKKKHVGGGQKASRREAPAKDSARQRGFSEPRQKNALQRMREVGEIPHGAAPKIAHPAKHAARPTRQSMTKGLGSLGKMHLASDYSGPGALAFNKVARENTAVLDCACPLKVGHRVKVDGMQVRGEITNRAGRRLTMAMDNGMNLQRDQRWVHAE